MQEFDKDKLFNGTVPWLASECAEVLSWYHSLLGAPRDDWDLDDRRVIIEHEGGSETELKFNMFKPMNQLGVYMMRRYDSGKAPYHLHRVMLIMEFLAQNYARLIDEGLARGSGNPVEVRGEVLEALCSLPFSKVEELKNDERRTFELDEVIQHAHKLTEENDS